MEIARSWIASAAERDRACMAQHFPKTLRTHYRGCGTLTFYRFGLTAAKGYTCRSVKVELTKTATLGRVIVRAILTPSYYGVIIHFPVVCVRINRIGTAQNPQT